MDELINEIDSLKNEYLEIQEKIKQKKKELRELKSPVCGGVKVDIRKDTGNYLLYIQDHNLHHWKWIKAAYCKDDLIEFIDNLISDLQDMKTKIGGVYE